MSRCTSTPAVTYDRATGQLVIPAHHALRITRSSLQYPERGRYVGRAAQLIELVPERGTHTFALHPDAWVWTFHSLTGKERRKISLYRPIAVPLRPGTLVADMYHATAFMEGDDAAGLRYRESVRLLEDADLATYERPELLIPPEGA